MSLSQLVQSSSQQEKKKHSLFDEYVLQENKEVNHIPSNLKRNQSQEQMRILLPFRNLAFVEELTSILNLLHQLSKDSQFWKLGNPTQFRELNSLIRLKTPLFFGSSSSRTESMISQIRPISPYEVFLQDSTIRETSNQPMFLPGIKSTRKLTVSGRKTSMKTEILQFSNMKNNFVSSVSNSGNLFKFKLQQLSSKIAFYLLGFLVYSSDDFSVVKKIKNHSHGFSSDIYSNPLSQDEHHSLELTSQFWTSFSNQLVDIQLHLLGAFYKICSKPESLRENLVRLSLFERSFNAYTESHGLSVVSASFSLKHSRIMLQKAFEKSLYLQNIHFMEFDKSSTPNRPPILDQLRRHKDKSKLLLDDFSKLGQGDNMHILKGTGSVGFKSSMRKATLSLNKGRKTLNTINERSEIEPSQAEANHQKYLSFIQDYYINK